MRYVYKCLPCDVVVEVEKPLAEFERVEKCATCGTEMARQMTSPPFSLKGGGWAKDLYQKPHVTFKNKAGSYTVPYDTRKLKKEDK